MKHLNFTVLFVDDSEDDGFFFKKAFLQVCPGCDFQMVEDGGAAIAYIMGEGRFADRVKFRYPNFIITDLKMPGCDGLAVLEFLKKNPDWAIIPTVVLSGSANDDDIKKSYMLGASSYHVKPASHRELVGFVETLVAYWGACEVPAIDETWRRLPTDSKGRLGERFPDGPDRPLSR